MGALAFGGWLFGLLISLAIFIPIAMWTQSNIEFWMPLLVHHGVHCPFWVAYVITFLTGGADLGIDIILQIFRMFV